VECWIGIVTEGDRQIVRLAGRLSAAQVPELLIACADQAAIELDLTDLLSADASGIEALQRLRRKGATLSGTPGYIQLQLHTAADPAASR
jgi:ABC-type transporter Mla MlaB component